MSGGEDFWRVRAESAEATVGAAKEATENVKKKLHAITETFGIKPGFAGKIKIDYEKLVEGIGIEGALELRKVIDEKYQIRGEPGEKPRVKVAAA